MNRLDLEAIAFHQRVRDGYHKLAAADPDRWVIIDAGTQAGGYTRRIAGSYAGSPTKPVVSGVP